MALDERPTAGSVAAARVDVWWRENVDRVRAYLFHQVDSADVEDLVQEVFVLAMRRWDTVPEPPIGWLLKTARHLVANHRRGGRRFSRMLGRAVDAQRRSPAVDVPASERAAYEQLEAMLDGLSAHDREVLTMTAWYGLSAAEAAEALGISVNAYTVRLHRARARLSDRQRAAGEVGR